MYVCIEVKSTIKNRWDPRPREIKQFNEFKKFTEMFPDILGQYWIYFMEKKIMKNRTCKVVKKLVKLNIKNMDKIKKIRVDDYDTM